MDNSLKDYVKELALANVVNGGVAFINYKVIEYVVDESYTLEFSSPGITRDQWFIFTTTSFVGYVLVIQTRMMDYEMGMAIAMCQQVYVLPKKVDLDSFEHEVFDNYIHIKFKLIK